MRLVPERRRAGLVCFVAITAVAGAMLVPVLSSHLAVSRTDRVSASVTDAAVVDDGDSVRVTLRLDNPTTAGVTVPTSPSASGLSLFDGDERLTDSRGVGIEGTTVPAGGTATLTLTLAVVDDHRPLASERLAGTRLSGSLPVEVAGFETNIDVGATVEAA